MLDQFEELYQVIKKSALDQKLMVIEYFPTALNLPTVFWKGDWLDYFNNAIALNVYIIYLKEWKYRQSDLIEEAIAEDLPRLYRNNDGLDDSESPLSVIGSETWVYSRLEEAIAPWVKYSDKVFGLSMFWVKDGIAHYWTQNTEWYSEHSTALEFALEEVQRISSEYHILRSKEQSLKFHEYAIKLANHPRFSEATSKEKREHMVKQIFPEIEDIFEYKAASRIAERATLVYWWEIEPTEIATKTQQVKDLYEQGESIRNIASILKMSEAKVKAAIHAEV